MSLFDAYRQKLDAQVEELSARIALGRAKAKQLSADTKIAAYEELAATEEKIATLKAKLTSATTAGEGAWQDLKGGLDSAWTEVRDASSRALKRFE
jgi:protoporphyrinogen oxidase